MPPVDMAMQIMGRLALVETAKEINQRSVDNAFAWWWRAGRGAWLSPMHKIRFVHYKVIFRHIAAN
jgi:hypothetical protein